MKIRCIFLEVVESGPNRGLECYVTVMRLTSVPLPHEKLTHGAQEYIVQTREWIIEQTANGERMACKIIVKKRVD